MINVNKLFRRLSIRTKLVIAFVLLGVVPVGLVGGYGAVFSFSLLNQSVLDALQEGVSLKAGEVQQFLESVREDVLFLSRLPTIRALIDASPDPPRSTVAPVEQAFLAFSQSRKAYYQIRYLSERGREVVRVDFDGERHSGIPPSALQDKRGRYYFREAMAVRPGVVYVSPMDLNEEWGKVEVPPKPVVRYATPLVDSRGEPRGIVIVNVYASKILSQVVSLGRERGTVFLMDSRGVYLAHPDRVRPGSGLFVADTGETLHRDFPDKVTSRALSGKPGTVEESGLRGRILAFAPIQLGPGRGSWIVAHVYSKGEVLSSVRSLQVLVAVLGIGVLVVALIAGLAAARQFTRPITSLIRGAEAVAAGDFDRVIRVETNDELEDLSHQFNLMARHLKEHERQLLAARERAERKAREAEALYRIGTEILALLSLPQILQHVVDKARELLKGDLAILCLQVPGQGLRLGAASGAVESLGVGPGQFISALGCEKVVCQDARCPAILGAPFPSHVAVAMRSLGRVVGSLCVASREPRPASPEEMEFLTGLANQAAIAIENARLQGELSDLARLEERERIAQDLHDGIIQAIYATGLGLEECVRVADEDPREVKPKLETAIEGLNSVIRDVRNYIVGREPEELRDRSLSGALDDLARGLSLNALLTADLSVDDGIDRGLSRNQVVQLFHICREALTNVVRHAQASRVALALRRENGILLLTVEDDGVGFDAGRRPGPGQGLRNMAERARRLGGELAVASAPGRGTRIAVRLPLVPLQR
ncbi:MAG: GAF domain-containing protein [Candidatus Rokubacteria bacterium]|nr:GAF domain-containing protein [Candidatus Rokubacteria bacterium]